jgi:hypothetical protein
MVNSKKNKRNLKLQIRISEADRRMIEELRCQDNFNISDFFRSCLYKKYKKCGLKSIGTFTVG